MDFITATARGGKESSTKGNIAIARLIPTSFDIVPTLPTRSSSVLVYITSVLNNYMTSVLNG